MTEIGRVKSPEEQARDRSIVEHILGEGLYEAEIFPDYDMEDFVARGAFTARALRHARKPGIAYNPAHDQKLIRAMNSLQAYVATAEKNPSSSLLRPGQIPLMRDLADFFELDAAKRSGGHSVLPTSIGKTVMFTELVHATGLPTLVVVPTRELIPQTCKTFLEHARGRHLDVGFVYSDHKRLGKNVTITTYASLTAHTKRDKNDRLIHPEDYDLVIYDEGHDLLGEERRKAIDFFGHAVQIAFTATDKYSKDKKLADVLPIEISRMNIIEAQENRMVAPHHNIVVRTETDMRSVYVASTGEYAQDVLYKAINTNKRNKVVIDTYEQLFEGKRAIAYCAGVEHAKRLAAMFNERGIAALAIDGSMTSNQRKNITKALKCGEIQVICNDRVLGVGFDEVSLEVALMVAPCLSTLKITQNGGRVTRLWDDLPDKVAYIVQYIDENYTKPPIIYAENEVSGYAQHAWDGFEYPANTVFDAFNVEGASLIYDPNEVKQLADQFDRNRNREFIEPPEGWKTVDEIAEEHVVSKKHINSAILRLERSLQYEYRKLKRAEESTDTVFSLVRHKGKFIHRGKDTSICSYWSPEAIQRIAEYIKEYELVPSRIWRSREEIASLYNRSPAWFNKKFMPKELLEAYPQQWGKYVGSTDSGLSRNYYSPELFARAAAILGLEDYSHKPPRTWVPERMVINSFGEEAYLTALPRLWNSQYEKLWFADENGAEPSSGTYYCTLSYTHHIKQALRPSLSSFSFSQIAHSISVESITALDLEKEMFKLIATCSAHSYAFGKYLNPEGILEYYCNKPELIVHIREQAIRTKLKKLEEAKLLEVLKSETDKDSPRERVEPEQSNLAENMPNDKPVVEPLKKLASQQESISEVSGGQIDLNRPLGAESTQQRAHRLLMQNKRLLEQLRRHVQQQ